MEKLPLREERKGADNLTARGCDRLRDACRKKGNTDLEKNLELSSRDVDAPVNFMAVAHWYRCNRVSAMKGYIAYLPDIMKVGLYRLNVSCTHGMNLN